MRPQLNEPKCVVTSIEIAMCRQVNYVKWFYTGGYIYHSSTIVHMGQAIAMYWNSQQSFGKYWSPRDVFNCTRRYWALEDEFYYAMMLCNCYNDHRLETMIRELEYQVNEAKMLVEDFQVLGAPVPCCYAKMIDMNGTIQLCKTLNCIQEENNRMAIRRNRYFMLKELFHTARKCGQNVNLIKVVELLRAPEYKSNTEIHDDNIDGD